LGAGCFFGFGFKSRSPGAGFQMNCSHSDLDWNGFGLFPLSNMKFY